MLEEIRWGILSTSKISHTFAKGLADAPGARIVAIGSRSQNKADAFGDEFDVPHRHSSYEDLANDPDVDVIYVSTPHPMHKDDALLCIKSGKAVLCEKPFAVNAAEAREVIAAARAQGVFLMEAMWTRFIPATVKTRELIAEGAIGAPRLVVADFAFRANPDPESRLFAPRLGGGALLDVGVYAVSFASMIFGGPPAEIASQATLGETGVDEQNAMALKYAGGQLAALQSAIRTNTKHLGIIYGTEGWIELGPPFWHAQHLTLQRRDEEPRRFELTYDTNGFNFEAEEVMNRLRAGELESPVMPLSETLEIMETMDALRAQWGLRYPSEQ